MATFHVVIKNLEYKKETQTFYTNQSKLKKMGILDGLKKIDNIIIYGIKEQVEFVYYFPLQASLVFAPLDVKYNAFRLVVDDK